MNAACRNAKGTADCRIDGKVFGVFYSNLTERLPEIKRRITVRNVERIEETFDVYSHQLFNIRPFVK